MKGEYNMSTIDICESIAKQARKIMVEKYGKGTFLCGHCIEASELIVKLLKKAGLNAQAIEGWCIYEDDSGCSDRCYDEHTWVECLGLYIDVTADQFNPCMYNKLPEIIVSETKPDCMEYDEPNFLWLDD